MGRMASWSRAPSSGSVIFYGVSSTGKGGAVKPSQDGNKNIAEVGANAGSGSTTGPAPDSPPIATDSKAKVPPSITSGVLPVSSSMLISNTATTIALVKTTADLFQHAPYVKVVAGVVLQIIQIVNEVQTNKDRCAELMDKVASYATVVFEALRSSKIRSGKDFEDLEAELQSIARVLESIYFIFQSLSVPKLSARISRVVHRDDILGRIQEQDRRLDTLITSFQLKSSIILRVHDRDMPVASRQDSECGKRVRPPIRTPPKPEIMFGRDDEIRQLVEVIMEGSQAQDVNQAYSDSPARLSILGPGGIGKTSLALCAFHDNKVVARFGDNRLFVSCEGATSVEHIISDLAFSLQITTENVTGHLLDVVLYRLRSSFFLIVLDNFETPWELPETRVDAEALLHTLTALKTATIILTARGSQYPAGVDWTQLLPPVKPVQLESAIAIFQTISRKNDEYVIKLVQAVDCVPLAVTLLGNLAAVDGETTEGLWDRWREENIGMVESSDDRLSSLDHSLRLSLSSPRMRRESAALMFLSLLSLLPHGMSSETFKAFSAGIPGIPNTKKALSTLLQNALVFMDSNKSIRILNPVRLYMIAHHPPTFDIRCCLQDHYIALAHTGVQQHDASTKERLRSEAENIEAMLIDSLQTGRPLGTVVEAILAFCHYTYISGMASSRPISLAVESLPNLGTFVPTSQKSQIDSRQVKAPWFRRVYFWKASPNNSQLDVIDESLKLKGDCLGCWGQILGRQMQFEEAQEKLHRALQFHTEAGDVAGHASDLHNLACLLSRQYDLEEAEAKFAEAILLHEKVGDLIGKAYDMMGYGHVFLQRSQFNDAETNSSTALQIFVEQEDELGQASATNNLAQISLCRSMFTTAESQFTQALQLNAKMGNLVGQAESLAGLSCALLLRSRFREARLKIEEAINISLPVENPDYLHILGRVLLAQCRYAEAKDCLLKASKLHERANDNTGQWDDAHYILIVEYYTNSLLDTAYDLETYESHFKSLGDELRTADVLATRGMVNIRTACFEDAEPCLMGALAIHTDVGSLLGQAFDLHHLGCMNIQQGEYDIAEERLRKALLLHTQVENVQGQADDANKLCEIQLRRQQYNEALTGICHALALHIQIEDIPGQADDLYIQACVFLEQSRLDEAEDTIRKALEMHSQYEVLYSKGRDLATLSSILWQKLKQSGMSGDSAIDILTEAIDIFDDNGYEGESYLCRYQRKEM